MGREVVEVGHGGAAPPVDGLAGVADGGDGVPRAAPEQSGEQQPLGHRGVLVLVEEDDRELLAEDAADLGPLLREPRGQGDLVAEVDEVAVALLLAVRADQVEEFEAGAGGVGGLAQVGVAELGAFQGVQERGVVRAQPLGVHQVLGELAVEGEEVGDEVAEGTGERRVGAGRGAQDAGG